MAKFLVVHPVGTEITLQDATPVGRAVKAGATVDAYWVKSWYAQAKGTISRERDARDAESARQALTRALRDLPVEGVYKIERAVDSEDFR